MQITAAVSTERDPQGELILQELELEPPRPDEILVRLVATGVCGSDLHGRGSFHPRPIVLGHEGAGVIVETGAGVTKVKVGDHVLLNYIACGKCPTCVSGSPKLCPHNTVLNHSGARPDGSTGLSRDGEKVYGQFFGQSSFATHCLANEQQATLLDPSLDLTIAPAFACGVQTGAGTVANGLRPKVGDSLTVIGSGAVGISAIMMARALGCATIIAIDVAPQRLELAREVGATHTLDAREIDDLSEAVKEIVPGGVQFSIDAAGRTDLTEAAVACLAKGGSCAVLGLDMGGGSFSLPHFQFAMTGVSVGGFPGGLVVPDEFVPRLTELYAQGRFPIDRLVQKFDFTDIDTAIAAAESGEAIKPVLVF